jgi:hypothetical protein
VLEADRGLHWSEGAQLYFSRTTGRFLDPKTKAWDDAEKDAWTMEKPEAYATCEEEESAAGS